jgi:hypothetical protein
LIPFLDSLSGFLIIGRIREIILWAVVAIMIIYVVFALISCLLGSGGGCEIGGEVGLHGRTVQRILDRA